MFVAGIDAHTTYSVIAIVNNAGNLVHRPERIANAQAKSLVRLLERFRPLEVVVETCLSCTGVATLLTEGCLIGVMCFLAGVPFPREVVDPCAPKEKLIRAL